MAILQRNDIMLHWICKDTTNQSDHKFKQSDLSGGLSVSEIFNLVKCHPDQMKTFTDSQAKCKL